MSDDTMTCIFQRHAAALFAVAQSDRVHIDAVRLALALAMREVADDAANNGVIEALTAKLDEAAAHINTLIAARDALRQQIAQLDADNAENRRRHEQLNRIGAWLSTHHPDLYDDDSIDVADGIITAAEISLAVHNERNDLRRECTKLRMWIDDANNAAPTGNGKSAPAAVLVQALDIQEAA